MCGESFSPSDRLDVADFAIDLWLRYAVHTRWGASLDELCGLWYHRGRQGAQMSFGREEDGVSAIEYGLTVAITTVMAITLSRMLGLSAAGVFVKAATALMDTF